MDWVFQFISGEDLNLIFFHPFWNFYLFLPFFRWINTYLSIVPAHPERVYDYVYVVTNVKYTTTVFIRKKAKIFYIFVCLLGLSWYDNEDIFKVFFIHTNFLYLSLYFLRVMCTLCEAHWVLCFKLKTFSRNLSGKKRVFFEVFSLKTEKS